MVNHGEDWIYIGGIRSRDARFLLRIAATRTEWAERNHYSELNFETETRDFRAERFAESVDRSWYGTAGELSELLKKYTREEIMAFATGADLPRG